MRLEQARTVLGLEEGESFEERLPEIERARGEMEKLARGAEDEKAARRYNEGLEEFDKAIRTVRSAEADEKPAGRAEEGSPLLRAFLVLVVVSGVALGVWFYLEAERKEAERVEAEVSLLEEKGAALVEKRLWVEAEEVFQKIAVMAPESRAVKRGMERIAAGRLEEQKRYVAYWQGAAVSAFEAKNWEEAEVAAGKVLERYPEERELEGFLERVEQARLEEKRQQELEEVRSLLAQGDFAEAEAAIDLFLERNEGDADGGKLREEVEAARIKAEEDLKAALVLYEKAKEVDTGEYNEEALGWLREAMELAPGNEEISVLYGKVAAYRRTVRVPEDVETLVEAMENAKVRDRIVVGPGVWEGPLVMGVSVKLEGRAGETVVQCAADAGSALAITSGVEEGKVQGIEFRHSSFDPGEERYPAVQVRGARVEMLDCKFRSGSGHGLAIMEGADVIVTESEFSDNGWNGISVRGEASVLRAENNVLRGNYQNGIEVWEGSKISLVSNRCVKNFFNGMHIDAGKNEVVVTGNTLSENNEYGLVLTGGEGGVVEGNVIEKNRLGGVVGRSGAVGVRVVDNEIRANEGPGLALEAGVVIEDYVGNRISRNQGQQLVSELEFEED